MAIAWIGLLSVALMLVPVMFVQITGRIECNLGWVCERYGILLMYSDGV